MKTLTKLALATMAAVLFSTGGASADDSTWHAVDNHHGSLIFMSRPVQQETTVAFGGHAKAGAPNRSEQSTSRTSGSVQRQDLRLRQVSTPHGTVSYFAPVD